MTKEPWEMTQSEFIRENIRHCFKNDPDFEGLLEDMNIDDIREAWRQDYNIAVCNLVDAHYGEAEKALTAGKIVPPEVLCEYPSLKEKAIRNEAAKTSKTRWWFVLWIDINKSYWDAEPTLERVTELVEKLSNEGICNTIIIPPGDTFNADTLPKHQESPCDVCGQPATAVRSSAFVAMSFRYCQRCLNSQAEPYGVLVQIVADAGGRNQIAAWIESIITDTLAVLNKTEQEFSNDVKAELARLDRIG